MLDIKERVKNQKRTKELLCESLSIDSRGYYQIIKKLNSETLTELYRTLYFIRTSKKLWHKANNQGN